MGATYAMTAMLELGFSSLLFQAAALYVLLGLFVMVYRGLIASRRAPLRPIA